MINQTQDANVESKATHFSSKNTTVEHWKKFI